MSQITLTLKQQPTVPLEAEVLCPDTMAALSHDDICALTVFHGKRQCRLDQFFDITGEHSDNLVLQGDLHRVRLIGRGMSRGSIVVHGSVGMHLGAHMKGGRIEIHGDASDWVGAEMHNGHIHIHGNAGGQIGAAYRGSLVGMRNGVILVDGSAGMEVGMRMRRGTIVVGGRVKDFTGLQMKGGTIVLQQGAEIRTGAWMIRGTIISLVPLQILPTFNAGVTTNPVFVNLLAKFLSNHGVKLPWSDADGSYQRFSGDAAVPGKGELFVWQPRAAS